ncbi:hypothetical protein BP5796_06277 [Coleophoma crateriformis]|uniref:Uncharacterized protein n=1 Tax=Coleophoma crateriformis TaxID=565419 RepID=A0A3D8RWM9_9HELO|nr:hypothetical protein BP5796_06277 [Coleophoma crateriformis]
MPWVRAGDETGLYHIIIGGLSFCSTPSSVKDFLRNRPDGPIDIDHCEMDSIGGGWVRVKGRENYAKAYSMPLDNSYLLYNIAEAVKQKRSKVPTWMGNVSALRGKTTLGGSCCERNCLQGARHSLPLQPPHPSASVSPIYTFAPAMLQSLPPPSPILLPHALPINHRDRLQGTPLPAHASPRFAAAYPSRQQPATYAPAYALPHNVTYPRPPAPPPGPGSALLASRAASPRVQPAPAAPAAPTTPRPRSPQSASAPSPHPARSHAAGAQPRSMTPRVVNGSSSRHPADGSKKPAR